MIVFFHIPKTGGTTLTGILRRQYGSRGVIPLRGAEALEAVDTAAARGGRAVSGHLPFDPGRFNGTTWRSITLLREPLARTVSDYLHVRRNPRHPAHARVNDARMSLADYCASGISLDNMQTRVLSGVGSGPEAPFMSLGSEALARAKQQLEHDFVAFGLTERFDESLLLMAAALGWKTPYYKRRNVNPAPLPAGELEPRDLSALRAHNGLDIELYAFAEELFWRRLELRGPEFARAVSAFRAANGRAWVQFRTDLAYRWHEFTARMGRVGTGTDELRWRPRPAGE